MRLLNLHTLKFKEFYDPIPPYAILSHRWGKRELTHQSFLRSRGRRLERYDKILGFCAFAKKHIARSWNEQKLVFEDVNLEWGWVDTCCIDKTSSAELSEAINSMFAWYRNAAVCFAYLEDVPSLEHDDAAELIALRQSDWFRRGWTLQELLAPDDVIFCNAEWRVLGHKCAHQGNAGTDLCSRLLYCTASGHRAKYGPSLNTLITETTGIGGEYLCAPLRIFDASIACRMSWAARRNTTRIEDLAYSLLGLFEVNMALLYGEGLQAFLRLQEELIRRSNDQSVFHWFSWDNTAGMFAAHPRSFLESSDVVYSGEISRVSYALSNRGMELRGPMRKIVDVGAGRELFLITLNCGRYNMDIANSGQGGKKRVFIPTTIAVTRLRSQSSNDAMARVHFHDSREIPGAVEDLDDHVIHVCAWDLLYRNASRSYRP
jgi:hypothetical protein